MDYQDIINLYKIADIVTFVSKYEGFGVPILEAQATGRPVITSNLSPMKEVAGKGAIFVDPYNVEDIRVAVKTIIFDAEFRQKLVKQSLENVKKYSAKSIAEKYIQLYKQINKTNSQQPRANSGAG